MVFPYVSFFSVLGNWVSEIDHYLAVYNSSQW